LELFPERLGPVALRGSDVGPDTEVTDALETAAVVTDSLETTADSGSSVKTVEVRKKEAELERDNLPKPAGFRSDSFRES